MFKAWKSRTWKCAKANGEYFEGDRFWILWISTNKMFTNISIVKPTRCTIFRVFEYHSTYFGRSFRPSSGVQVCTYSVRYMSYRFVDRWLVATRWTRWSILWPLTSSQQTCMTYTWRCMYSLGLLTMNEKTETCRLIFNKFEKLCILFVLLQKLPPFV
jgi:hypothetical protein